MESAVQESLLSQRVSPLWATLRGFVGGLLGLLSGNPVIVLLGAVAGVLTSGLHPINQTVPGGSVSSSKSCASCGSSADLETCAECGRPVCPSCRQLIMGQEERAGRTVYRHYVPEQAPEDASLSLMPRLAGEDSPETPSQNAYRLGDELYVLDDVTGELVPFDEGPETPSEDDFEADLSDSDGSAQATESDGWTHADAWSAGDWESGSWDSASTDDQGG